MILHDGRVMESLMMIARGLVSEASWSSVRNFQKIAYGQCFAHGASTWSQRCSLN